MHLQGVQSYKLSFRTFHLNLHPYTRVKRSHNFWSYSFMNTLSNGGVETCTAYLPAALRKNRSLNWFYCSIPILRRKIMHMDGHQYVNRRSLITVGTTPKGRCWKDVRKISGFLPVAKHAGLWIIIGRLLMLFVVSIISGKHLQARGALEHR